MFWRALLALFVAALVAGNSVLVDSESGPKREDNGGNETGYRYDVPRSVVPVNPIENTSTTDQSDQQGNKGVEPPASAGIGERTAIANERLADYAFAGLILTIAGLLLLSGTLIYTRTAAEAAKKTLEVTEGNLEAYKGSTATELRAYIGVGEFGRADTVGFINDFMPARVRFQIINTGKTPANDIAFAYHIAILPINFTDPDIISRKTREALNKSNLGSLGGNGSFEAVEVDIEVPTEFGSKEAPYFFGFLSYRDIYSIERFTCFCRLVRKTNTGFEFVKAPIGNAIS